MEFALSTQIHVDPALSTESIEVVCLPAPDPRFEMRKIQSNGHRSLHAKENFSAGQILAEFTESRLVDQPSYLTVQVGDSAHILLKPSHLELINHSCDPNVYFDVETSRIKALKEIRVGEELTFFYPSTEWQMTQPFRCHCRSEFCLEVIRGAAGLSHETMARYEFNPHIRKLARLTRNVAA